MSHNIPLLELLVNHVKSALPQVKQIHCFQVFQNQSINYYSSNDAIDAKKIKDFGKFISNANTGWYDKSETPLAYQKKVGQVSLEGEIDRDHLFIKSIEASEGMVYALIQCSPFSLGTQSYLNSAEKKVIEISIRGFMKSLITTIENDRLLLVKIAHSNEAIKAENKEINDKLEATKHQFESTLSQLIQLIVNRLQKKYKINVKYDSSFIQALMNIQGPIDALEEQLSKQLEIDSNLAMLNGDDEVWLHESYLRDLQKQTTKHVSSGHQMQLGRYAKTYQLLDRYEESADLVVQNGLKIIGKNIGLFCSPSISNAAITDALNKHARKIYELFEKYPDRWPILRAEFRSVANIIEKESHRRQAM